MKELLIAADHAGFETKEYIKQQLVKDGYTFKDFGTFSTESMDYPDVVHPLATQQCQRVSFAGSIYRQRISPQHCKNFLNFLF